jgi:hypothetical protein
MITVKRQLLRRKSYVRAPPVFEAGAAIASRPPSSAWAKRPSDVLSWARHNRRGNLPPPPRDLSRSCRRQAAGKSRLCTRGRQFASLRPVARSRPSQSRSAWRRCVPRERSRIPQWLRTVTVAQRVDQQCEGRRLLPAARPPERRADRGRRGQVVEALPGYS